MSYLSNVKQIELEARFNQKLGNRKVFIPVFFVYLPHLDELQLSCQAAIDGVDKAFICCVTLDLKIVKRKVTYKHEERWLNELLEMYKDRMNELLP